MNEQCYICADEEETDHANPLYRVCKCDVRIHRKCFTTLVTTIPTYKKECMVCKEQFRTRERTHPCLCKLLPHAGVFLMTGGFTLLTIVVTFVVSVYFVVHYGDYEFAIPMLCVSLIGSVLVLLLYRDYYKSSHRCGLCERVRETQMVVRDGVTIRI